MVSTEDDRDGLFTTGREHRGGDRRHFAVQHDRQQVSGGKRRAAVPVALVNDEIAGLEADMAPA